MGCEWAFSPMKVQTEEDLLDLENISGSQDLEMPKGMVHSKTLNEGLD